MTVTEQRKPGRPRSAQADQAILDATLRSIAEEGIQGMSLEGVAARAGVGKTTIYRRWANKEALILDALRQLKPPIATFDTGNLRSDIEHYLSSLQRLLDDPLMQRLSLRMLGELTAKPAWFTEYLGTVMRPNLATLSNMIDRARARGELRADVDTLLVMDLIGGPAFYHMIISFFLPNQPPFPIEQFVELLWAGLKPYTVESQREQSTDLA